MIRNFKSAAGVIVVFVLIFGAGAEQALSARSVDLKSDGMIGILHLLQASTDVCGRRADCILTGTRDPIEHPFSQCSPFNHPIGQNAVYSAIENRYDNPSVWSQYGSWVRDWATFGCMSTNDNAIYVAGKDLNGFHQGLVRRDNHDEQYDVLLPDGIREPEDVDKHIFIIDPANDRIIETWHARVENGNVYAPWVVTGSLSDRGILEPDDWRPSHRGTRAYGGSGIAGLIRPGELVNGIHHTLAIKVPPEAMNYDGPNGNCFTWPATACDGSGSTDYSRTGNIYMGSLLAIPLDSDLSFISEPRIMNLAIALQQYGAYVVDGGSPIDWNGFPGCIVYMGAFDDPDIQAIQYMWEQLGRVTNLLKVVTNNGPDNIGGGGKPLACFSQGLK